MYKATRDVLRTEVVMHVELQTEANGVVVLVEVELVEVELEVVTVVAVVVVTENQQL